MYQHVGEGREVKWLGEKFFLSTEGFSALAGLQVKQHLSAGEVITNLEWYFYNFTKKILL